MYEILTKDAYYARAEMIDSSENYIKVKYVTFSRGKDSVKIESFRKSSIVSMRRYTK